MTVPSRLGASPELLPDFRSEIAEALRADAW